MKKLIGLFNSQGKTKEEFAEEVIQALKDSGNIVSEESSQNKTAEVFIGFIMDNEKEEFNVQLINNSDKHYVGVIKLTGAFCSDDGDLIETSKSIRAYESLKPNTCLEIDSSDWYELDYVIWYHLDLITMDGKIEQYYFQLPKGGRNYDKNKTMLPIIHKEGVLIELETRQGNALMEEVKTMDMKGRITKYNQ